MTRLYLDLETERAEHQAFTDEKILAVGFIIDRGKWQSPNEQPPNKEARMLSEWSEGDEQTVVRECHALLERLIRQQKVEVIGFNIVKFDIPLLKQKMCHYQIAPLPRVNRLWWQMNFTDLKHIALPLYNMRHHKNSLADLIKKVKAQGLQLPSLYGNGSHVTQWYQHEEYDEIEHHLIQDVKAVRHLHSALRRWQKLFCP